MATKLEAEELKIIPKLRAEEGDDEEPEEEEEEEEDLVDPHEALKEECGNSSECSKYKNRLDTCTTRVSGKSDTQEACVEEFLDFVVCVDKCAAPRVLKTVK